MLCLSHKYFVPFFFQLRVYLIFRFLSKLCFLPFVSRQSVEQKHKEFLLLLFQLQKLYTLTDKFIDLYYS